MRRKVSAVSDQQDELKEAFIAILKQVGELFNSSGESQLVTVLNMGVFAAAGLKQLEKVGGWLRGACSQLGRRDALVSVLEAGWHWVYQSVVLLAE